MRSSLILPAVLLAASPAAAQAPAAAPAANPPARFSTAPRIPLDLSVEAAQTAIKACAAQGFRTTAIVADSAGVIQVLLTDDGLPTRPKIGMSKIAAARRYGMTSGEVAEKATADAALAAEIAADPAIEVARQGAVPVRSGGAIVGYVAVGGAPSGDKDEACVRAGLARIADRLPG